MRAILVQTAKAWGRLPSELGICEPDDDLGHMVAWEQAERTMIAWERQEADEERARQGRQRGAKNRA
jgi:hypothetical protein